MRENYEDLPTADWTDEEAMHHLSGTFDRACKGWPGLMEPYIVELAETDKEGHKSLMRRALRETIGRRI